MVIPDGFKHTEISVCLGKGQSHHRIELRVRCQLGEQKPMKNKLILVLIPLLFFSCYSKKNKTESRAKERVTQFVMFMVKDQVDEAEKMLSSSLVDSGNKEFFLQSFDDYRLKDSSSVVIDNLEVLIPPKDKRNRAVAGFNLRSTKYDLTKMVSIPMMYEKGDWYLGL